MTEPRTFGRRRTLPPSDAASASPPPPPTRRRVEAPAPAAVVDDPQDVPEAPAVPVTAGWGGMEAVAAAGSDFAQYLKVEERPTVFKILDDDGPFDSYMSHWVDEIEDGSKSVRCWGPDSGCPLCTVGDKAKKFSACFNVVSLSDPDHPALKIWEAGIRLARQLKEIHENARQGPLDRHNLYFAISKTVKTSKSVEYNLVRIRDDELDFEPLTKTAVAEFAAERQTQPVKEILTADAMAAIVDLVFEQD